MTVKELIEKLEEFPEDKKVMFFDWVHQIGWEVNNIGAHISEEDWIVLSS